MIVLDDSDSWLRLPSLDRSPLAEAFFSDNVRLMALELDCGLVLAVHEEYLDLDGYRRAESHLSTTITLPPS